MESVYSTKLIVLAAKFEGRRWSASRGLGWAWGPHPFLSNSSYLSAISVEKNPIGNDEMTSFSVSQKVDTKVHLGPTFQARPRGTDHLRPSNLAAGTLSLVEHTLSKFGDDPCPVRRGLAAAVKCYVRKARFFSLLLNRTKEARECCVGLNTTKGKTCFVSCFPIP